MKQRKKQYRPIADQTWFERILDWFTREENFGWSIIGIVFYAALMLIGTYISANILKQTDMVDAFFNAWFAFFPIAAAMALLNPLGAAWGVHSEKNLQNMIKDYLAAHNRCIYDELVAYCMLIKIHLGIDSAIETMLQCHELVGEDGCYRLPTDEDRKKWREQWLAEWGVKISFEDLKKIFALDLKELEESIDIEFSLGEHDALWIGKTKDEVSGEDVFWLSASLGERCDFTTFQEMVEAKLFDGKNLKSVWADATLTSIDDYDMISWLDEHLS
ncbi:hypothetical protein [Pseudoflavonifractor phocaeensis]|uniref:hypothetical protein n=1 Tax=Pseudoflavonifractor phocaeensis TaxID=1870988 RepID=UPI001F47CA4F|nr:hypothetical protein [Pseudoflavonifractor phocaeensis]MCF2595218.1 hypothetical protein [Pseudoflavonifractor phocaeensis]